MPTQTQITDEELRKKLEESYLDQSQKNVLKPLIPKMNAKEREELLALIDESHEVADRVEQTKDNYQKELYELNKEYEQKMNTVIKEETANARKQFEGLEAKKEEKELEELESEISKMQ